MTVFHMLGIIYLISYLYCLGDLANDVFTVVKRDRRNYIIAVAENTDHEPELDMSFIIIALLVPMIPVFNTIYLIETATPFICKYITKALTAPIGHSHKATPTPTHELVVH